MATRYAHTNIVANNWQLLAEFYSEVFDCVFVPPERKQSGKWLEDATAVTNAELQGIHLRLPGYAENGPTLEIFSYKTILENKETVANLKGFGHIAFEVDDVEKTMVKLLAKGGSKLGKIVRKQIEGVGVIRFTYARDPEGNIIEIQNWS